MCLLREDRRDLFASPNAFQVPARLNKGKVLSPLVFEVCMQ